jgi:hypothetical protein
MLAWVSRAVHAGFAMCGWRQGHAFPARAALP